MKKLLACVLAVCFSVVVIGCSSEAPKKTEKSKTETSVKKTDEKGGSETKTETKTEDKK